MMSDDGTVSIFVSTLSSYREDADHVDRGKKNVYWQENKVIYSLYINYPVSRENEADQLILDWMNSFEN